MYQILYTSKATHPFTDNELKNLLELARVNNASKSITGMLLYCNSHFIQLLEGNEVDVLALFNIITSDDRHTDVKTVLTSEMSTPQFPDWSMGYQFLTESQLKNLEKHENIDIANYIRQAKPFKLLKLLSTKSWN